MADPLGSKAVAAPPPTLAVLEETVQLLRQAPFATLVRHWIGSVPFALGLLTFWNGLTTGRMTDEACALDALALSLLLLWMNCWRAVFAGRLRRQLSGTPAVSWTPARVARLAAGQSFLGATRLVMLPLAALVAFPFAAAVDFYRYATALADREDLDPLELISRARALTRVHPGRSWAVLPVLAFLQLVMALNLALAFGFLPFLIRALTGYESEFTRGGTLLLQSPMFAIFVLVATWLAIDPFVQAAYTVRLFHAESVATGEDLRVALRRLRAAQMLAAILLLAIFPARAVSPAELQQSVQKAMQAPEYGWRIPPPAKAIGSRPWVLLVADKILDALNSMWRAIGRAVAKVLEWLFGRLGVTPSPGKGTAPGGWLHWSLYLLMAVVAGGAMWVAWRRLSHRALHPRAAGADSPAVRLADADLAANQLPEERWMEMALECQREENYRLALRAYYLANLAWLGQAGYLAIHAGKTNREYESELRRKAPRFAEARGLFTANVSAFEAAWYGLHEVTTDAVAAFRDRIEGMKKVMV